MWGQPDTIELLYHKLMYLLEVTGGDGVRLTYVCLSSCPFRNMGLIARFYKTYMVIAMQVRSS
jgi:hypothetical protein